MPGASAAMQVCGGFPRASTGEKYLLGVPRTVPRPVLLYDAGCRLCRFAARVVAALDRRRRLALLGLEDGAADRLLEQVPRVERLSSLRLVLPDGSVLSAGHAMLAALELLPATRPLTWAAELLRAQAAVGALYCFIARNRGRLGGLVPDGPAPHRFP